MSKFEKIAAFILVVEEHGFAAAARKKKVSTAAVSRQITALENELGTQLLRRTTRQVSLTDIGEQYYQQCKKTLGEFHDAEMMISGSKSTATGVLNIMANRYFSITHLLPKLGEFMRLNPSLQINLQLAENFPDFNKENIDILFGVSVDGPDELVRRRITTTRYVLCASKKYLKKYGIPKTPADLAKYGYITHSMRKPNNVISFKQEKKIHVTPSLLLNDSQAMRECALQGLGIINVHDYIVSDALQDGRLIEVLREYQEPQKNIYLYYRPSKYLQPKIRKFIEFYAK